MVEEYEEIADPSERPDDPDDDLGKTWFINSVSIVINVLGGHSVLISTHCC